MGTPAERGPERGPEFGMDPQGTGCKGRALKEDVLSKAEARSNRMLEKELTILERLWSVGWQYWHLQRLLR